MTSSSTRIVCSPIHTRPPCTCSLSFTQFRRLGWGRQGLYVTHEADHVKDTRTFVGALRFLTMPVRG